MTSPNPTHNAGCGEPCGCLQLPAGTVSPYSVPNYAKISILLLRKDSTKQNDILTIEIDPFSDGFIVTFEQKITGVRTRAYYEVNSLYKYLAMYFKALTYDENIYDSVTFNVPLFPSISLSTDAAAKYLKEMLSLQIQALIPVWPTA
jgi:hypothetical protein